MEQRGDGVLRQLGPAHGDAQGGARTAVGTVGGDEMTGAHRPRPAGADVAHRRTHAVGSLLHPDQLDAELDRAAGKVRRWRRSTGSR